MKRLEITIAPRSLTIHSESEQCLTGEQKYNLLMALILSIAGCIISANFFSLRRH